MEQLARLYNQAMSLAKQRMIYAEHLLKRPEPSVLDIEIVALQVRKICESIAYGCALAYFHSTVAGRQRWLKEYRADKIIRFIVGKDKDCFPRPIHLTINIDTHIHTMRCTDEFKPVFDMVCKLYNQCDQFLHEFKPDKLPTENHNPKDKFVDGLRMFRSLLAVHQIKFGTDFLVTMVGDDDLPASTTFAAGRPPIGK